MAEFVTVANTDEIPNGEGRSFEVADRSVAIFNVNGKFKAIDNLCPHMAAPLAEGDFDIESCNVACPWHGWRFNVTDGAWADNPKIKTDVFEVKIVGDEIQVRIESDNRESEDKPDSREQGGSP